MILDRHDVQQVGQVFEPVLAPVSDNRFCDVGGNPPYGSKGCFIRGLHVNAVLSRRVHVLNRGVNGENARPAFIRNTRPTVRSRGVRAVVSHAVEGTILIGALSEQKFAGDSTHHQAFPRGLQRAISWEAGWLKDRIVVGFGSTRCHSVVLVPPVDDRGSNIRCHPVKFRQFLGRSAIHVETAFFVSDSVNNPASLVGPAETKDAELAASESDITELLGRVIELAAVVLAAPSAVDRVLVEKRFGLLDPRQRQVMGLYEVAIILHDHEVQPGGMENADHDDR